ncbi:MAG TPA: hypothetical protein VJ796_08855 [Acidimicrobiia bacterium]|nr:hypothetical protein [Acidimicrobiia bacterium]
MNRRKIPVACNLELSELGQRQQQWTALIERSLIEKLTTDRGVRLVFDRGAEVELFRLATAERECCGFASWTVRPGGDGGFLLDVEADGMGTDAVRAMFE